MVGCLCLARSVLVEVQNKRVARYVLNLQSHRQLLWKSCQRRDPHEMAEQNASSVVSDEVAPTASSNASLPTPSSSSNSLFTSYSDFSQLQDPFLPRQPLTDPIFLDNGACRCALRHVSDDSDSTIAWRCLGNSTTDIYKDTSGKWFPSLNQDTIAMQYDDNSNPPTLDEAMIFDEGSNKLMPINATNSATLSIYDSACDARNETTFSTAFYRADQEQKAGQTPVDAAVCWRAGAYPIQIQNVSSWDSQGCPEGFFCRCFRYLLVHSPAFKKFPSLIAFF